MFQEKLMLLFVSSPELPIVKRSTFELGNLILRSLYSSKTETIPLTIKEVILYSNLLSTLRSFKKNPDYIIREFREVDTEI